MPKMDVDMVSEEAVEIQALNASEDNLEWNINNQSARPSD